MVTDIPTPSERYWLCPLYSFNCYSESVALAEGIQIKRAPDELRKYIAGRTYHLYGRWDDPSEFDWAAFLPYRAEVVGESEDMGIEEKIRENARRGFEEANRVSDLLVGLITALRLCHKGGVVAGPLEFTAIDKSGWHIGGHTVWTLISKRDFLHKEPKYILHQSDFFHITELIKNLNHLRAKKEPDNLSIALRRFNSAYHGELEDRLIDQMIAFESLYIADDKELGYKLRLRTAFFLGKKRAKVFSDMKKAYDLRGQIMHGNKQVDRSKLEETIPKTEEYLRQSIRRFLSLSTQYSITEIRKQLDENILKNGKPLALKD